ncbi:MAG: hypothetical protein QOE84_3173 [Actinomycetota bacterium]|nr:hypothetical protein [Actinomycetota bacterium]
MPVLHVRSAAEATVTAILRLMRMRLPFVAAASVVVAAMPSAMSSAAAAGCGYALQLNRGIVDGSGPRVPPGYDIAEQPAASPLPAELSVFGGAVTSTDKANCRTNGVTVRFQSRDAKQPAFLTRRTLKTDPQGGFTVDARPTRTATVRAVATAPDGTKLTSALTVVRVRTYVSATYTRLSECDLAAAGSTYPAKPNHPVNVEIRVGGIYRAVATGRTDSHGVYRTRWNAGCGTHDLAVSAPASSSNEAGRTLFVRRGVPSR